MQWGASSLLHEQLCEDGNGHHDAAEINDDHELHRLPFRIRAMTPRRANAVQTGLRVRKSNASAKCVA